MPDRMPVLFVGHGSPLNAIEDNAFSREWIEIGKTLPTPEAILCVSAHWETAGTQITAMPLPPTIHDFSGFPRPLYEMAYPAPGAPDLARRIKAAITDPVIHLDFNWGLDHGTWSVLCRMFPAADIPVLQLSLDFDMPPGGHYALGKQLRHLRHEGVLVMGSGNMVHNLRTMRWQDAPFDWARDFDALLAERILGGDHEALVDYPSLGAHAGWAIPTNEHYLPLLVSLGLQEASDEIRFFNDKVTLGTISMRSLLLSG